ncbi:hypothetical protein BV97_03960 [Novosphingobium resinovorum]|uniref:Uncharacterized protein n=1 Tax=Novosphingobium resinovorum TaxID=158500 RepID=A0A031JRV3_9SPHN|nr:hypothetical protein [Novosphingobium resinovorum]EZP79523.1 hypothetical protein BV97_03960 [Novosphingobium resinovorum]
MLRYARTIIRICAIGVMFSFPVWELWGRRRVRSEADATALADWALAPLDQ